MAFKQITLSSGRQITIYKRKASRSLRLSITPTGQVRVSIPIWTPYHAGVKFAESQQAWIDSRTQTAGQLLSAQAIGKAHHLRFVPNSTDNITSRIKTNEVVVSHPAA